MAIHGRRRTGPLIARQRGYAARHGPFLWLSLRGAKAVQVFLTNPEGRALAALTLGFDDAPLVRATVEHWRHHARTRVRQIL